MPDLTVAANVSRVLLEFAISRGGARSALTARSGIDPVDLENGDTRIPFSKYVALMKAGQELCRDPALSLHFGEAIDCTEVSLVPGDVTTIDDACALVNRYAPLTVEVESAGNVDRFQLRRAAGQLWLVDARRNPNDFPELSESTFARIVCTMRRLVGDRPMLKTVQFTHTQPAYRAEYERIFRVPVEFGSERNALRLDEGLLSSVRFPAAPRYVTGVLKDHADALLDRLDRSRSIRAKVESLLVAVLQSGDVGIDAISGKLGQSRQTLFRKLKLEGVTFEQVLDELRHKLALHYLSCQRASVKQTACLLGFSDTTAFSRAFKRWTGHTPGMGGLRATQSASVAS